MNAKRILKEARPLFWPWCAVALAGALPLVYPLDWAKLHLADWILRRHPVAGYSLARQRIPTPNAFPPAFSTRRADGNLGRKVERYHRCDRVGGSGFLPGLAGDLIPPRPTGIGVCRGMDRRHHRFGYVLDAFHKINGGRCRPEHWGPIFHHFYCSLGELGRLASRTRISLAGKPHRCFNRYLRLPVLRRCNGVAGRANAGAVSGDGRHGWR